MKRRSARRLLGSSADAGHGVGPDARRILRWTGTTHRTPSREQVSNDSVTAAIDQTVAEEPEEEPLYGDTEDVRVSIVLEEQPTLMRFSMPPMRM